MFSEPGLKHVVWKNKDVKMNMAGNLIETLDVNNENQALYICTTSDFPVEQIEDYVPVGDHNALERLQLVRCFYLSEIIECFDLFEEAKYVVIQDLEAVYKLGLARNYSEAQSQMVDILRRLRKLAQKGTIALVYDTEIATEQTNRPREFVNSLYDEEIEVYRDIDLAI